MVYQRVSKLSSLTSLHKKESTETAANIPLQTKSVSAASPEQEMPSYTPLAANWATNNNLMRSMSGNQVVQRQQESGEEEMEPIQAKLTIGQVGDKYEQEADQTAQLVVNQINAPAPEQSTQSSALQREEMPEDELQMKPELSTIQREEMPEDEEELQMQPASGNIQREEMPEDEEELQMQPASGNIQREEMPEDELQMKSEGSGMAATPDLEASIQQAKGGGQPLADNIREPMEKAFGADFSGVNVHTDAQSDQLNQSIQAKAFTTGQDVFFRQGAYDPSSRGGQELIAHELTHVVQQNGGGSTGQHPNNKQEIQRSTVLPTITQTSGNTIQRVVATKLSEGANHKTCMKYFRAFLKKSHDEFNADFISDVTNYLKPSNANNIKMAMKLYQTYIVDGKKQINLRFHIANPLHTAAQTGNVGLFFQSFSEAREYLLTDANGLMDQWFNFMKSKEYKQYEAAKGAVELP